MDKVGVQAVTFKSGANKDMLSPFNPPEATSEL
jgi:ClpP class serine protease